MNCPKGTHYNFDAESCMKNLTPEEFVFCVGIGCGIIVIKDFIIPRLISRYRRDNGQQYLPLP